jgi:hypothetical protein
MEEELVSYILLFVVARRETTMTSLLGDDESSTAVLAPLDVNAPKTTRFLVDSDDEDDDDKDDAGHWT